MATAVHYGPVEHQPKRPLRAVPGGCAVLEVRCRAEHEAIVFELQGEISTSTSALLQKCLDAAFEIHAGAVIVDLTDVAVFAEAGVEVLAETRERCASTGREFQLRSDNSTTASILDLFDWTGGPAPSSLATL